jgi:hypothetical protein
VVISFSGGQDGLPVKAAQFDRHSLSHHFFQSDVYMTRKGATDEQAFLHDNRRLRPRGPGVRTKKPRDKQAALIFSSIV